MSKPKVYEALQSELGSSSQKKERPVFRKLLWALSWTGIIVLLLTSLSSSMFEEFDKVLHFTAYMTLGILFTLSQRGRYIPISLLSILFLSALIEGVQSFIGRSPEWNDFVVNMYGIGTGSALGGLAKAFIHYFQNEMSSLVSKKRLKKYKHGDVIFPQDAKPKYLYVVTKGEVSLFRTDEEGSKYLGNIQEGGVFGEMGLLTGSPRFAEARAEHNTVVFAMGHSDLFVDESVENQNPLLLIIKTLSIHLQRSNGREDKLKDIIKQNQKVHYDTIRTLKKRDILFREKLKQLQQQNRQILQKVNKKSSN